MPAVAEVSIRPPIGYDQYPTTTWAGGWPLFLGGSRLTGKLMIEIVLKHADLARMRFAHSPVRELIASLRVLNDHRRRPVYHGWLTGIGEQLRGVRLDLLVALAAGPHPPDFLTPSPTAAWGVLAEELAAVAAASAPAVRAGLEAGHRGRAVPAAARALYDDPAGQLPVVVEEMNRYWQVAIEPIWQRLRALCAADVSYRLEQVAVGGVARVLGGLHSTVSFAQDRLLVERPGRGRRRIDLDGSGILLIPCAFAWPALTVHPAHLSSVDSLSLIYPPRGVAELWQSTPAGETGALSALLGRTRATLLAALGLPTTTTELAHQLDMSAAAISQHLKILKACGLVAAHRRGRTVLYHRTAAASALLAATG